MKKILPLVIVVAVAVFFYVANQQKNSGDTTSSNTVGNDTESTSTGSGNTNNDFQVNSNGSVQKKEGAQTADIEELDEVIKPAYQVYNSADDAFTALKKGAVDYDDILLEQFSNIGPECAWCNQLFGTLQEKMKASDTTADEKSYYAEVLAISGRKENVAYLLESIKNSSSPEDSDIFAEALEVVSGGPEVVEYLGQNLDGSTEELKESVVAALTNHGSKQAIDLLYNETTKKNDPDGFYALGIGLGEVIPDEEAMPYLTELAKKRDDYSHLAVKALLNSGVDGLKLVMDLVGSSDDADSNKKLLTDAIDHVPFEEDTEEYLKQLASTTSNASVKEFAQSVLSDFQADVGEE